jgi:hypothetical protein
MVSMYVAAISPCLQHICTNTPSHKYICMYVCMYSTRSAEFFHRYHYAGMMFSSICAHILLRSTINMCMYVCNVQHALSGIFPSTSLCRYDVLEHMHSQSITYYNNRAHVQQDILRLLTLWFKYGGQHDIDLALADGFLTLSIDTWLDVIPQVSVVCVCVCVCVTGACCLLTLYKTILGWICFLNFFVWCVCV